MSTVVQQTYRPQIAPATPGLVANLMDAAIKTKDVETAAGIGFGLAVSQGSRDDGCILGGSQAGFIGVSVRDITLVTAPVDPLSDTANAVDKHGPYTNAAVLSRGDIWVLAGTSVAAGNDVSFNATTGVFGTGTGGISATGWVRFTQQPAANSTIVIDGHNITFKASGAVAASDEVNIGPTLGDTLRAVQTLVVGNASTNWGNVTVLAYPPSPGGAGQGSGANELHVAAITPGTAANSYTLTVGTSTGTTVSAATLLGGLATNIAIAPALSSRWATSAQAGELAILSLGVSR